MPQALYSFFDEYDFSGKTIVPFNVHNGSRFSGTISTIKELEPDAEVIENGFTVSERDVAEAAGEIAEWLEKPFRIPGLFVFVGHYFSKFLKVCGRKMKRA